ncbi:active regulator of SIRT1 [Bactrocera dorsalis]|uniref:Active regulator of SIRT1 n=1 Tax=Bactrocera dorsalis TaxID=27457 RepID=A0A6I9URD8_BACDO|nr:active regulator of SIRT1 [Bactrocera dorsalis]
MSLKLLKQSLDILDETSSNNEKATQKTAKTVPRNAHLSKSKRKQTNNEQHQTLMSITKEKKNIEDVRKELQPDQNKTNTNLKRLLALSQNTITPNDANKIIKRNNKGKTIKTAKKPKVLKSIFTEEDFLAFEREYFPTS